MALGRIFGTWYNADANKPASGTRVIDGDTVELDSGERVRYLRIDTLELETQVFLDDGTFVNAELVWEGYAKAFFFEESRYRQIFVQLQLAASQAGNGGWSACGWK